MIGKKGNYIGEVDYEVTPINNGVVIKIDYDPLDVRSESGLVMGSDYWDEVGHLVRFGTVVSVCDRLHERHISEVGIEWGTEIEVQVGDVVFFTLMGGYNSVSFLKDGQLYAILPYSELVLRVREEQYFPLNGYVILDKAEEGITSSVLSLDHLKVQNKKKGKVRWIGSKLRYYFPLESSVVDIDDLSEGDDVMFSIAGFTSLEDSRYATLSPDLGYLQRRWIIAKFE